MKRISISRRRPQSLTLSATDRSIDLRTHVRLESSNRLFKSVFPIYLQSHCLPARKWGCTCVPLGHRFGPLDTCTTLTLTSALGKHLPPRPRVDASTSKNVAFLFLVFFFFLLFFSFLKKRDRSPREDSTVKEERGAYVPLPLDAAQRNSERSQLPPRSSDSSADRCDISLIGKTITK